VISGYFLEFSYFDYLNIELSRNMPEIIMRKINHQESKRREEGKNKYSIYH